MNLSALTIDLVYFALAVLGDGLIILAGALIAVSVVDGLIYALNIIRG